MCEYEYENKHNRAIYDLAQNVDSLIREPMTVITRYFDDYPDYIKGKCRGQGIIDPEAMEMGRDHIGFYMDDGKYYNICIDLYEFDEEAIKNNEPTITIGKEKFFNYIHTISLMESRVDKNGVIIKNKK